MMTNLYFPPTAKDKFRYSPNGEKYDAEENAEGFRMAFPVSGSRFLIGIDLPKKAAHGGYMIIFYTSLWQDKVPHSIVETGLSFSDKKKLNFLAVGPTPDQFRCVGDAVNGQQFTLLLSVQQKPRPHITCTMNNVTFKQPFNGDPINHLRLVIAAGDREGAYYSEAKMTLLKVDDQPPVSPGKVEFMTGKNVNRVNSRSVFNPSGAFSLSCSLPVSGVHYESGPADAMGAYLRASG